jgi:hypothetical protein
MAAMPRTHSGQRGHVSVQSRPWRFSAPTRDKISPSLQRPQKGEHQRYCTRLLAAAAAAAGQACYGLVCCLLGSFLSFLGYEPFLSSHSFVTISCLSRLCYISILIGSFLYNTYARMAFDIVRDAVLDIVHTRLLVCS